MNSSPDACAEALLEIVPLIMRSIRAEVRRHGAPELSIPQFRALAFVGRNEGATLSDLAAFLALTPPSASKLVDGLVAAKFVSRKVPRQDRRRVALGLSARGRAKYVAIVDQARSYFARKVAALETSDRAQLLRALGSLHQLFAKDQPSEVSDPAGAPAHPLSARERRPSDSPRARVSRKTSHAPASR